MRIDKKKCVGCGNCHIICTMGAISSDEDGKSFVNQDECVECSTCYRVLRNEGYWSWIVRALRRILSIIHLGMLSVSGIRRMPRPAPMIIAFMRFPPFDI